MTNTNVRLANQINIEESIYPLIPEDEEVKRHIAHFLATHPAIRREWREDQLDLQRFNL